ncbi:hypothetical protein V8E36_008242 [Tilletia maclaganii]
MSAPAYDVVFSHLSVRLIKSTTTSPNPLNHIAGPLQLVSVNPPAPLVPTLVFSLPGFTLPFRTFDPSTVTGASGIHDAEPPRPAYPAFGAGEHGLHGPAIWFGEHITEEGAAARQALGQQPAIWTLYLIGAPPPLGKHLLDILAGWPRNMPRSLPRWLSDPAMYGWPWKDTFIQMPLPLALALPVDGPLVVGAAAPAPATGAVAVAPRPLPTPPIDAIAAKAEPSSTPSRKAPSIPTKPSALRASPVLSAAPAEQVLTPPAEEVPINNALPSLPPSALVDAAPTSAQVPPEAVESSLSSSTDSAVSAALPTTPGRRPVSSSGRGVPRESATSPPPRQLEILPSLPPSVIVPNLEHNAWAQAEEPSKEAEETPSVQLRSRVPSRSRTEDAFPAEYRHSLVAVDNETGEVLGILASNVVLNNVGPEEDDGDETITTPPKGRGGAEEEEEDGGPTPTTSRLRITTDKEAKDLPPKPLQKPFTAYRDPDIFSPYAPSTDPNKIERPPSRLGQETFAPPPLPAKKEEDGKSVRDSMGSAVFFSAAEELSGAETTDDEREADELRTGRREMASVPPPPTDTFRLVGDHPALRTVEAYREGLLQDDQQEEDGAESDRSGSTVGGILTRAFNKRKKKKAAAAKKAGQQPAAEPEDIAVPEAVEAVEELMNVEPEVEIATPPSVSAGEPEAPHPEAEAEDVLSAIRKPGTGTTRTLLEQHLPRSQLRTSVLIDVEHRVWTEALAQNEIPASAPYTHLAVALNKPSSANGAEDEGWISNAPASSSSSKASAASFSYANEHEDGGGAAPGMSSRAAAVAAVAGDYVQGGTVLLKFLQGTISASMVKPAEFAKAVGDGFSTSFGLGGEEEEASRGGEAGKKDGEEEPAVKRTGAMAYIPVLPVHMLYYMGIVTDRPPAPAAAAGESSAGEGGGSSSLPSAAQGALDSVARAAGVGFGVGRLWKTLVRSAVGTSTSTSPSSLAQTRDGANSVLASLTPANMSLDLLGISKSGAAACWDWLSGAASNAMAGLGATGEVLHSVVVGGGTTPAPLVRSNSSRRTLIEYEDQHGDDDDEWEVKIPDFDPNSLGSTPRPIYRRKTKSVVPSLDSGFGVAGQSRVSGPEGGRDSSIDWKRVSIVHFDAKGVGRRAILAGGGVGVGSSGGLL